MAVRIGVIRETARGERRVAMVPEVAKKLGAAGMELLIEQGAGLAAGFTDGAYGVAPAASAREVYAGADIVFAVQPPSPDLVSSMRRGAVLVGALAPFREHALVKALRDHHITAFALELLPRTTRAQAMDILSSQAAAAGYKAMLIAAQASPKFFPMLTTAAGTVPPAKVLVLGAGVAGLQAIATARRLGAVVSGYDVRPEAAEQIASLGAKPVQLDLHAEGEGGYARQLDTDEQARQHEQLTPHVADADVVISTAAVPGRPAPILITHQMVHRMRAGAVIVDAAAPSGGNCEVSYAGERRVHGNGVIISGPTDLASRVAADASQMYARNVLALLERLLVDGELVVDVDDEVVGGACVTHRGEVRHPLAQQLLTGSTPSLEA